MPDIEFDEASHTYSVDGRKLISVTQALEGAGLIDGSWFTPLTTARGEYVHKATELYDQDRLNEDAVDDDMRGYVEAWKRFRAESECEILAIEERVWNRTWGYAGTLDRVIRLQGVTTIGDIKTGSPAPWHALQTAGYARCKPDDAVVRYGRATIHLSADGKFKLKTHSDPSDMDAFLAALCVAQWKTKHGVSNGNHHHRAA